MHPRPSTINTRRAALLRTASAIWQERTTAQPDEVQLDLGLVAVVHDLKQPLSRIRIQTQTLQRCIRRETHPQRRSLELLTQGILDATDQMNAQLNRLLDTAHPMIGPVREAAWWPTDLVGLVRSCAENIGRTAVRPEISLESQLEALVIPCDVVLIQSAISNLIDNAVKYNRVGGVVHIRVDLERTASCHEAIVSVNDSGLGIPASDMDQIFKLFRRGTNVAGVVQGSGVGLASAREAVLAHGGTITVASVEGVGTTFTIRLPVCAARCTTHRPSNPAALRS